MGSGTVREFVTRFCRSFPFDMRVTLHLRKQHNCVPIFHDNSLIPATATHGGSHPK